MSARILALLLWAITQVETPYGTPAHPGPAGETGRYGLTPSVRHDRGRELRAAGIPITDENLARAQVEWIRGRLIANHSPAGLMDIAIAYNAGVTAKVNGRAPDRSYDYGARVVNLVEDASK